MIEIELNGERILVWDIVIFEGNESKALADVFPMGTILNVDTSRLPGQQVIHDKK